MAREKKPVLAVLRGITPVTLGSEWTEKFAPPDHEWRGRRVMALDGVVAGEEDRRVYLALTRRQAQDLIRRIHGMLGQGHWYGDV